MKRDQTPPQRTVVLLLALLLTQACPPAQSQSLREQEIAQCLAGEVMSWGDGVDRPALGSPMVFVYDPSAAPAWFDQNVVLSALERAATAWSLCGVPGKVVGRTLASAPSNAAVVWVRWSDLGSRGNFGLADFGQRSLTLGPAAFALLKARNPAYDARQTLQMVISHEMGHLFGLMTHSKRCVDVTSSYVSSKGEACFARDRSQLKTVVEYRSSLPTACDIARCKIANGHRDEGR